MARILLTRRWPKSIEASLAVQHEVHLNETDTPMSQGDLAAAIAKFDIVCPAVSDRIDADVIGSGGRVRIIANYGAGVDHIDLSAAKAAGIVVSNTPDVLTEATAELPLLLMMMVSRRASEGERELRSGDWSGWRPTHLTGRSLRGKVLGLIGYGRIARATARIARAALGVETIYHSRRAAPNDEIGARYIGTVTDLVAEADIVSLHCPGGTETRHLIDAAMIARMKPGALLINTARGSVVDEVALAAALVARKIGGASLDVYEHEPAVHPSLLEAPNVVLLPHLGSATLEAREAMGRQVVLNLEALLEGREPPTVSPNLGTAIVVVEAALRDAMTKGTPRPFVLGISGAQGSGKSTLSAALAESMRGIGVTTAVLSIDDIYHIKADRIALARQVHPLSAVRGVPGTHDVGLGLKIIEAIDNGCAVRLPRFDKATDDRASEAVWDEAPCDTALLILEGWCLGAQPEPEEALIAPINDLERLEDSEGHWRRAVNIVGQRLSKTVRPYRHARLSRGPWFRRCARLARRAGARAGPNRRQRRQRGDERRPGRELHPLLRATDPAHAGRNAQSSRPPDPLGRRPRATIR